MAVGGLPRPDWAGLGRAGQGWTGLDWTEQTRTGPDWTGLDWAGLDWTLACSPQLATCALPWRLASAISTLTWTTGPLGVFAAAHCFEVGVIAGRRRTNVALHNSRAVFIL